MTSSKTLLLLSTLCISVSTTARAETAEASNVYVSFSTGPQAREKASDSAGSTTFKAGFVVNGALGYRMDAHRVEAEFSYFNNRCETTDPTGPAIGAEPSSGDVDVNALMANYYYDFNLSERRIQPFLSAGYGVYRVSINGLTTPSLRTLPAAWGGPVVVYAKSTWAPAYQVRAGVKFKLNAAADIVLGYRFLQGADLDVNLSDGSVIHPDAEIQSLEMGLNVKF